MNDLERNGIIFPKVTVNTKFLNCLQPEWLKYVTQVHLAKILTEDTYDDLFNYLQQFENRAKKLEKSHDPFALVANTGSSYRTTTPHTSFFTITQRFSNPSNNRLRTSSNTRNQAIVQADRVNIQSRNSGNDGRNTRRLYVQEERKSLMDEAGVTLTDEENDFLFADASRMEEIEELSANICLMARIQPANFDSYVGPSYDSVFLSEVQIPSNCYVNPLFAKDNQEQKHLKQPKISYNESFG
ncbi:hypothetical protein Tco_1230093 [Tanacetum coccineum]